MTDRPIIFGAHMIQALLAGRKSQTRRVLQYNDRCRPEEVADSGGSKTLYWAVFNGDAEAHRVRVPCFIGDRLWVREAHAILAEPISGMPGNVAFRAGHPEDRGAGPRVDIRWRPSIFMPRWASRITLIVTDVRVQRLQDINEEDAEAEGCEFELWDQALAVRNYGKPAGWYCMWMGPEYYKDPDVYRDQDEIWRASYRSLWNSLHGPDAWDRNPWVAAISFRTICKNIDEIDVPPPLEPPFEADAGRAP